MKFFWVRIGSEWTIGSPFESESRGVFAWDLIGFESAVPDEIGEEITRAG